jgi:hypothetical protein
MQNPVSSDMHCQYINYTLLDERMTDELESIWDDVVMA